MINKKGPSGVAAPSRPIEKYFQDDYNTKLEIKQVSLVPREEMEELVRILGRNIDSLKQGQISNAIWSLTTLKTNIEKHLGGMN